VAQSVSHDHVAVVRVGITHSAGDSLIVDLLEVGRDHGSDRRIGRATDAAAAAGILHDWLVEITARGWAAALVDADAPSRSGRDAGVTLERRPGMKPAGPCAEPDER